MQKKKQKPSKYAEIVYSSGKDKRNTEYFILPSEFCMLYPVALLQIKD